MDKIEKALKKLSQKEKKSVGDILEKLNKNNLIGLNVQKLKGREGIFRVRKGDIRIICRKADDGNIFILAIERRSEKTYKNF